MGKQSGVCQFCGEIKPFARAHVISKTLFKEIFKKYKKVHLLNVKDLETSNKVQDAFFDTHILCAACDGSFASLENYFTRFVKGELLSAGETNRISRKDYGQYLIDTYQPVDTVSLRLFYLLTLWRCSISQQQSFNAVDLGDDEGEVLTLLQNHDPGDYRDYATVLVSFGLVDDIRALGAIGPANATVDSLPITVILFNQWAIVYCLKKNIKTWFFQHALDDSGNLAVILFKEPFGVEFLHQLTHNRVHLRKREVPGV